MNRFFLRVFTIILTAVTLSTAYTTQAQVRPYRVTDRQVQTIINRIETRTDMFRRAFDQSLDRSRVDGTRTEDMMTSYITDFENATDSLRSRFDNRQSTAADVQEVLNRAAFINNFMINNRLSNAAHNQWTMIRNDLNSLATYYGVRWNWSNTGTVSTDSRIYTGTRPYNVSDSQLMTLLSRIEQRTDTFRRTFDRSLDNSRRNGTRIEDVLGQYVEDFENATDSLRRNFDERDSVASDVEQVLSRATVIDSYVRQNSVATNVRREWNLLRGDLNTLANYYRVSWNWYNPPMTYTAQNLDATLTGTYRLNLSQSDNVASVVDRMIRDNNYNANQSERVRRNLERRLTAPEMLAIEKINQRVTLASTLSPQVSFEADNVTRQERTPNGRTVSVRTSVNQNGLLVSHEGDRMNDYTIEFTPLRNGQQLRVVRRVYLENRNEMVTVSSVYDKVDQVARWTMVDRGNNNNNTTTTGGVNNNSDFVVPNGTRLVAVLDSPLSTNNITDGERFTMRVTSPGQFDGAIIEGTVGNAQRSGRVTGRAEMSLNFETIRLRNGQTYRFTGLIDNVRTPNGDSISINNEGAVRDSSQTNRTITRAGIGAALGALIGAIAGGGEGAAVGAAIGAGAGAGSVILQGRGDINLESGTEFTITSSAPVNMRSNY